jgi:hypothetical protein
MSFTVAYIANPRDKIEQITPVNNLELRSTTAQVFNVDIGKYKKIWVVAKSSHDADVEIRIRLTENVHNRIWNGENWEINDTVVLPANTSGTFHLNTALPYLNDLISTNIMFRIAALETPSTGELSISIFGELIK